MCTENLVEKCSSYLCRSWKAVENHGFLWIRGKLGAGKSTIMSFAYKEATKHNQSIVISFFFNARGGSLERSTTGMYRSLLF
ncbi:hypothetical protein EDB81DRAFT_731796 [Dactylonectria macrodidyma]|uniref:Nephrocystin 3-like N-terminal domain-containing protein n=1 Tax=Dactylonectria macrodidyma TaxID=307937 RepID=A0A9P9IK10_9HYPO|nr:hypothetical protein EDB81DRAFT_731796 [Dactylonectria macrodidyma]